MASIVYKKSYEAPPIDKREALRYAGVKGSDGMAETILDECIDLSATRLSYKLAYRILDKDELPEAVTASRTAASFLGESRSAILVMATVGMELDRLIARYERISSPHALMLSALGSERVEALVDLFEEDISSEVGELGRRFSPGYGDIPLSAQVELFRLIEPHRYIGLSLSESLLMSPSKSVSAIIPIKDRR